MATKKAKKNQGAAKRAARKSGRPRRRTQQEISQGIVTELGMDKPKPSNPR